MIAKTSVEQQPNSDELSPRELQILHLIADEYNSREIAKKLFISEHTVITYRRKLLCKFKVKNMPGAIRRGFELGYLKVVPMEQAVVARFM